MRSAFFMRPMNRCELEGEKVIQVYLLEVGGLRLQMEETGKGGFAQNAAAVPGWDKLAAWQQEKVSGCAGPGTRAQSMGAQLLLQYGAYKKAAIEFSQSASVLWQQLSYPQLLVEIPSPLPLQAAYEPRGKPYIRQVPWHYNLSHSGDFAALAVSDAPVGIDIQQVRPYRESLVKRFFSQEEADAFEKGFSDSAREGGMAADASPRMALFYTLWCRKEAYGKLTGTGLTEDVLKRNMLKDTGTGMYEYGEIPGYCVCVCGEKERRGREMPIEPGGQELR